MPWNIYILISILSNGLGVNKEYVAPPSVDAVRVAVVQIEACNSVPATLGPHIHLGEFMVTLRRGGGLVAR